MKTLRFKLSAFYIGSLLILAVFFYVVVHTLALPHATHTFLIILTALALIGFVAIYKITASLTYLSAQIRNISTSTLHTHVRGIAGDDEISQVARSFNNLLDRLNEAFTRERQFIGDMAHELKTPIAVLRGTVEMALHKSRTKEEYKKALEEALRQTDHLSATLNDVLDLAWTESAHTGHMPIVDYSSLIEELSEIVDKMAEKTSATVHVSIAKGVTVAGYKEKLARAIMNITDNALKYMHKGVLSITLTEENAHAILLIKDTGPGIPKEDLPHIFERFFRGVQSHRSKGSGLGLAIAYSIIKLHQGTIRVESRAGKGVTFILSLPAAS